MDGIKIGCLTFSIVNSFVLPIEALNFKDLEISFKNSEQNILQLTSLCYTMQP
jgi:hypothetical protein